jgi:tetratricopeptide (TPR) repeat protein/transcriptional regulator with XRE-family HTH domain
MLPDRDFAADLQSVRLQAGLSVRELVRSCQIPRSTIADALSGRRFPRLETVLAIVRACGADPDPWRRRWAMASREQSVRSEAAAPGVPAQLPRDIPGFASRGPELARLNQAGVALVHGRPGVGKTALAVHWAHSAAGSYPDGQLFVNLRGHHPTLAPMAPVEALGRLLGSLGVRWVPVTDDPEEGASVWRSAVAGRRVLIVLDDAVRSDQVRPLLPGTPGCAVVVTSRRYLSDLLVRDGADGIVLDVLPPDSSLALLGQVAGAERVQAEPRAAAAVAAACGHLPLAVRLAGAVLAGAPQRRFADLVAELTAGDRLTALEELARPSEVESAFELSYRALAEDARLLFRRLGLHPGPEIGAQLAALLVDLDADAGERSLRMLAGAHMVEPAGPGRYRMHDLLRDYAARLVDSIDGARQRDAARRRLFDWYVDRALAVSSRLDKGRERLLAHDLSPTWEPDDDEASAWLSAEYGNVIAVIEDDARRGTGRYAWTLIDVMAAVLSRRRDMAGLITATDAGLASARRQGDRRAEGVLCVQRGWLRWRGRQTEGAAADFEHARTLLRDTGVRRGEASALRGLSGCRADAGRFDEARRDAETALELYRAEGDATGEATTLTSLAFITHRAADFTAAASYTEASLTLHRNGRDRGYIALALANLAGASLICGHITRAVGCAEEAVALAREVGDGASESIGLVNAAEAHVQAGSLDEAYRQAAAAVTKAREMSYPVAESIALDALATVSRWLRRPDTDAHRARALRIAEKTGDLVVEAEILVGAARDAYQTAVDAPSPATHVFQVARNAAQRALDAGLAADSRHVQAEATGLAAACELGLGKVADARTNARHAVETHVASGARLAQVSARCVLAHALFQDADPAAADLEWRTAAQILDELAVPAGAPVRRLLDRATASRFPLFA